MWYFITNSINEANELNVYRKVCPRFEVVFISDKNIKAV